jgi:type IV pilus assembly protein PilW
VTNAIQQAGYFPDPIHNTAVAEFPVVSGTFGSFATAGQPLIGLSTGTPQGDAITVRYISDGTDGVTNCTGGSAVVAPYTNTFTVDAVNGLLCAVNGAAPVALVSGVRSMTILYGVRTDPASADNRVDSYLQANEMSTANWANVMSVQIQLTFANPLAGQPKQPPTILFTRVVGVMSKAGVQT